VKEGIATKFELPQASGRLQSLEGMRGFAALMVFFVHFNQAFGVRLAAGSPLRSAFAAAGAIGHTGVDIFFALSGFLMYGIVLSRRFAPGSYFSRRVQRLYPTFGAIFFIYLLASYAVPRYSKIPPAASDAVPWLLENLALLPGIFPILPLITVAWSLSYEWLFYLLLPAMVIGLRLRQWQPRQRAGFFASFAVLWILGSRYFDLTLNYDRFAMFMAGILVWELVHGWEPSNSLMRWGERAAIAGFVTNLAWIGYASSPYGPTLGTYTPSLFVSCSALLLCAVHHDGILRRALSWRQLRWVGNMSYSYYLTHATIIKGIRFAMGLHSRDVLSFWAVIGLLAGCELAVLVGSVALYLAVEHRFSIAPPLRSARLVSGKVASVG
jgi:exopolysaccharide production protein ExoZ